MIDNKCWIVDKKYPKISNLLSRTYNQLYILFEICQGVPIGANFRVGVLTLGVLTLVKITSVKISYIRY